VIGRLARGCPRALAVALAAVCTLGAGVALAAFVTSVQATGSSFATYAVPSPPNLRCTGLRSLLTSELTWDAVTPPPGHTVSYEVTQPDGRVIRTTNTFHPLPILSLLAGQYAVRTVIAGWRSPPSTRNVTLAALGLLYLCS
jgi:hypothetical protein